MSTLTSALQTPHFTASAASVLHPVLFTPHLFSSISPPPGHCSLHWVTTSAIYSYWPEAHNDHFSPSLSPSALICCSFTGLYSISQSISQSSWICLTSFLTDWLSCQSLTQSLSPTGLLVQLFVSLSASDSSAKSPIIFPLFPLFSLFFFSCEVSLRSTIIQIIFLLLWLRRRNLQCGSVTDHNSREQLLKKDH